MRLSFHFFIHLFYSFVAFRATARAAYDTGCPEAIHDDKNL